MGINVPLPLLWVLLQAELYLCQRVDFSFPIRHQIGQHLVNKRFRKFKWSLQSFLSGPDGDCLSDKNSYEILMQELLLPLHQSFVVLESVLADHVLVPQCRSPYSQAFVLEYKVMRKKLLGLDLQEQLKEKAQHAIDKINKMKYVEFVSNFYHVKEIVKIGLAFFNRTSVALIREIDHTNCEGSSSETSEVVESQYDYKSEWE